MSGTRRNPRHNGSERPGSRPHEANILTWFNEYMDVFFLCPGAVLIVLLCVTGIRTDKEPTGQSALSILEPFAVIPNSGSECQYLIFDVQHFLQTSGPASNP